MAFVFNELNEVSEWQGRRQTQDDDKHNSEQEAAPHTHLHFSPRDIDAPDAKRPAESGSFASFHVKKQNNNVENERQKVAE